MTDFKRHPPQATFVIALCGSRNRKFRAEDDLLMWTL